MIAKAQVNEVLLNQRLLADTQKLKGFEDALFSSLVVGEELYLKSQNIWLKVRVLEMNPSGVRLQNEENTEIIDIVM